MEDNMESTEEKFARTKGQFESRMRDWKANVWCTKLISNLPSTSHSAKANRNQIVQGPVKARRAATPKGKVRITPMKNQQLPPRYSAPGISTEPCSTKRAPTTDIPPSVCPEKIKKASHRSQGKAISDSNSPEIRVKRTDVKRLLEDSTAGSSGNKLPDWPTEGSCRSYLNQSSTTSTIQVPSNKELPTHLRAKQAIVQLEDASNQHVHICNAKKPTDKSANQSLWSYEEQQSANRMCGKYTSVKRNVSITYLVPMAEKESPLLLTHNNEKDEIKQSQPMIAPSHEQAKTIGQTLTRYDTTSKPGLAKVLQSPCDTNPFGSGSTVQPSCGMVINFPPNLDLSKPTTPTGDQERKRALQNESITNSANQPKRIIRDMETCKHTTTSLLNNQVQTNDALSKSQESGCTPHLKPSIENVLSPIKPSVHITKAQPPIPWQTKMDYEAQRNPTPGKDKHISEQRPIDREQAQPKTKVVTDFAPTITQEIPRKLTPFLQDERIETRLNQRRRRTYDGHDRGFRVTVTRSGTVIINDPQR